MSSGPHTTAENPIFSLPFSSQCKEKLGQPLPPQYALELLTVYAWEYGNRDSSGLYTAQCFRTVLELIIKYRFLLIYWTWCYDFKHEINDYLHIQLKKTR